MKILLFKYICLPFICLTSAYSYVFLNNQSIRLDHLAKAEAKAAAEKRIVIHNPKNNSTKVVIIEPPKDSTQKKEEKKKDYAGKDKNMLPDVEFLKFIIDKGKEGIPVLRFNAFFASLL